MDAWTFSSPRADGSACIARGSTYQPCLPVKGSASRKSTRAFGSSASCPTISGTSTWSRRLCNPSTTRSARGCHLCLRYDLSPMCPGWTIEALAEGVGFEPTIRFPVYTLSKRAPSATRPSLRERCGAGNIATRGGVTTSGAAWDGLPARGRIRLNQARARRPPRSRHSRRARRRGRGMRPCGRI